MARLQLLYGLNSLVKDEVLPIEDEVLSSSRAIFGYLSIEFVGASGLG
ncbi:hypothetical protein [Lyngbya aestuarii]